MFQTVCAKEGMKGRVPHGEKTEDVPGRGREGAGGIGGSWSPQGLGSWLSKAAEPPAELHRPTGFLTSGPYPGIGVPPLPVPLRWQVTHVL